MSKLKEYNDYRMIMFEDEFQTVMQIPETGHRYFGEDYDEILLTKIYRTDCRKLLELFSCFSKGQRLLYALVVFNSEVNNGGIAQFFFNSNKTIIAEVIEAFQILNSSEYSTRYLAEFKKYLENEEELNELHKNAMLSRDWEFFRKYQSVLDKSSEDEQSFDDWFSDQEQEESELDRKMREYISHHKDEFVIICDNNESLERQKVVEAIDQFKYIVEIRLGNKYTKDSMSELFHPASLITVKNKNFVARQILSKRLRMLNKAMNDKSMVSILKKNGKLSAKMTSKFGFLGKKSLTLSMDKKRWLITDWS